MNWIATWLAAACKDWDAQNGEYKQRTHRLDLLRKLYTARQERDLARARIAELRAYWRQDQDLLSALQCELSEARATIATLTAERDSALSRLGEWRPVIEAMEKTQ